MSASVCALCAEPNVRDPERAEGMGALALWLDGAGKTRVVHARCKRRWQAAAHGARERKPRGPRRVD